MIKNTYVREATASSVENAIGTFYIIVTYLTYIVACSISALTSIFAIIAHFYESIFVAFCKCRPGLVIILSVPKTTSSACDSEVSFNLLPNLLRCLVLLSRIIQWFTVESGI